MGTVVAWIAVFAGIAAIVLIWKLQRELSVVTRRLDRYNRALFNANDEIRQLRDDLATTSAETRVLSMREQGELVFRGDLTMREVVLIHPQAEQILAAYHVGGCSSCAADPDATLQQICYESGLEVDDVIANLNQLVATSPSGNGSTVEPIKVPNVEFSF